MKKLLPLLIFPGIITACSNNPNIGAARSTPMDTDTAGLAEFREWKSVQAQPATKTVYVVREVESKRTVSQSPAPVYTSTTTSPEAVPDVPGATQTAETQKKGWSKAAKGAAIGAGSGAVLGAVIHKRNRVVGGVVGGAVGAGVGYGIGRHIDKKDGRY